MTEKKKKLRSADWFNDPSQPVDTALYLERYMNFGLTREELQSGRPVIGIAQSGSDLAPCNRHHLDLAKRVREGIRAAGGIALEFPVHPIQETGRRPTAALDRNLCALGLTEILHGYPLDGVVLTTGCDKTMPAQLMAVATLDLPAIVLSGGPMLNGWQGERRVGSGTIVWEARDRLSAGQIDLEQFMREVAASAPSIGHCNTMGTALTMNCLAEALGMSLPGCAAIPAAYRERTQMAYRTGLRIVEMVREDLRPSAILTRNAFLNAIKVCSAIGGSTNAPIHLQAIAQCAGVELSLDDWQRFGFEVPLLVDCQPAGEFLGEDFHRAGGVPAVIGELLRGGLVDGDARSVSGRSVDEEYRGCRAGNARVIRALQAPLRERAGFQVLSGNLFRSALIKTSVIGAAFRAKYLSDPARPDVFRVRAVVFEGPEDYHARIDDPALAIDELCILVMRNCGPIAYPGSAEVINMAPPRELIRKGVAVLPCMGDGRQSGTSASPSILHASPEAAAGGGLALLRDGDLIEIDLRRGSVNALIDDAEMERRRAALTLPVLTDQTPWQEIYRERVSALDEGATLRTRGEYTRVIERFGTPRNSH
ncbi:MAG: dihydroxy-acid dehydratase family protein [Rudaea sp.]|uniref:IlvD/Edd family dehydratase n=1 Tax=unclassified Rudaea TaxID=2627037 RepID=UPI0010F92275|nr:MULTISPECIES: IlvD/Edd family dehydratase [unclassified Rudaea]MBN8888255.1 dihydroxy-acid dehydratase family protein [Rudaea sp.]